jgi:hypothetical protein
VQDLYFDFGTFDRLFEVVLFVFERLETFQASRLA